MSDLSSGLQEEKDKLGILLNNVDTSYVEIPILYFAKIMHKIFKLIPTLFKRIFGGKLREAKALTFTMKR